MLAGMSVKGRCRFPKINIELIMNSGEVQNFVGIHPTPETAEGIQPSDTAELRDSMVREFRHFHPDIIRIFKFVESSVSPTKVYLQKHSSAEDVKRWPLFVYDPMPNWAFGKVLLIGDAAHPVGQCDHSAP